MELPVAPMAPIPQPPQAPQVRASGFHKNQTIVIMAYIAIGAPILAYIASGMLFERSNFIIMLAPQTLFVLVPALLVVLSRGKSAYNIGKVLLIIQYVIVGIVLCFLLLLIKGFQ